MRDLLVGFTSRDEGELEPLWEQAFFVLDTSALIELAVKHSPKTQAEALDVLGRLKDRLWLPHQVAVEFVHVRPRKRHEEFGRLKQKIVELEQLFTQNGVVSEGRVSDAFAVLSDATVEEPDWDALDVFEQSLGELFKGRIGPAPAPAQLLELYDVCRRRYAVKLPPGYADVPKKDEPACFGDCIIWHQILEHAKTEKQPAIVVTGEQKDDWWGKQANKKIIGPRPEMIVEMRAVAGVDVHFYSWKQFYPYAADFVKRPVKPDVVEEFAKIEEAETARAARAAAMAPVWAQLASDYVQVGMLSDFSRLFDPMRPFRNVFDDYLKRQYEQFASSIANTSVLGLTNLFASSADMPIEEKPDEDPEGGGEEETPD